ncbi:MAG: TolB family protein [Chloroflexi bacterium]|nr:TolB family protein [Chloroflexota bacterium]
MRRIGQWFLNTARNLLATVWRFIGRVGLAIRSLLTWFLWLPLFYLTMPIWLPLSWVWDFVKPAFPVIWRFLGRMGLACRKLVIQLVWRPFLLGVVHPTRWLFARVLRPFTRWLLHQIWHGLIWLGAHLRRFAAYILTLTAPRRHLWRRRIRSRWFVLQARWRVKLKRPSIPPKIEVAPIIPRINQTNPQLLRLATAFATIAVIVVVAVISLQEPNPETVAADTSLAAIPQVIILTPTPLPATVTVIPTPEIILTPWPTPDPTTGGGTIAFSQNLNGNMDVYILSVGQSEPVRLTTHPAIDRDPAWSADGSKLAFASNRTGNWDIFVYDIPRGELIQVTTGLQYDAHPSWSPDGLWIAYESYQNDNLDIYLTTIDKSQPALRLSNDPAPDFAPAWEPVNGRHIAFTSWRTGDQEIFIRSLDDPLAENMVNVSSSPETHESGAAFSANGRLLAYAQNDNVVNLIVAVPLNEAAQVSGPVQSLGQQGLNPSWSPDNESIVSVYNRSGSGYLVAGNASAWGVTPQVYVSNGRIGQTAWSGVNLTPDLAAGLYNLDRQSDNTPLFVEALAPSDPTISSLSLLYQVPVNAPSPYLSDQVDQSFAALRERMLTDAGWDVLGRLDKMFEPLNAGALPGQSAQTWNKAGRAFDISYGSAIGLDPQIEVVREEIGTETYWRLFVRTAVQDGSMGEPLRVIPWDFRARTGDDPRYYDQGGKLRESIPSGYYIDFTTIAADYGWTRVPSGSNWRTYFPDILFWHYENHQGMAWEDAMRELYLDDELTAVFNQD